MNKVDINKLNDLSFFKLLSKEEQSLLINNSTIDEYSELYTLNSINNCDDIPVVLSGMIRLYNISDYGREMTIYKIEQGEVCSLSTLCILNNLTQDYIIDITPGSIILKIPSKTFLELFNNNSGFSKFIYKSLSIKLLTTINKLSDKSFVKLSDRITRYIKENVNSNNELLISHYDLSVELGTAREVISRELKKLEKEGIIETSKGKIILI